MIETLAGIVEAQVRDEHAITIDMGAPRFGWREIPLAERADHRHLKIGQGPLQDPVAVSMGNPHMVFFVPDAAAVPLHELGPELEVHPMFPARANVGVVQVESKDRIALRVWERGAGLTLACGTGACAALVAAHLRGLTGRKAQVKLPGGILLIEWREDDEHLLMTGPAAVTFEGKFDGGLYAFMPAP
jgi:diaminopimelate epimerase